jgi:hypothetical protein
MPNFSIPLNKFKKTFLGHFWVIHEFKRLREQLILVMIFFLAEMALSCPLMTSAKKGCD